jgi:hypothetical protein
MIQDDGWEIDLVSKKALPKPGYLESFITFPKIKNRPSISSSSTALLPREQFRNFSLLLPPTFDLASVSISSAALSTARDMFREKDIIPSPMLTRKLHKRFYAISKTYGGSASLNKFHAGGNIETKWCGGTHSHVKEIKKAYSEIMTSVTSIKQIDRKLNDVQQQLLVSSQEHYKPGKRNLTHSSLGISNSTSSIVKKRRSILESSIDMESSHSRKRAAYNNFLLIQQEHQIRKTTVRNFLLPITDGDGDGDGEDGIFSLTAAPKTRLFAPNSSSVSSLHHDHHERDHAKNTSKFSSSLSSSILINSKNVEMLKRETYHLEKELEANKSLLSHHLHSHLTSAHQGNTHKCQTWYTLIKLACITSSIISKYEKKLSRIILLSSKNKQAVKIQKTWKKYRIGQIKSALAKQKNSELLMKKLGFFLRCRWRTRYASLVRSFCRDFDTLGRFGKAIRLYRWKIIRVQKMYRNFLICKNARVTVLSKKWNLVEKKNSWKMATSIKSIFYYLAHTSKEEKLELEKRKLLREKEYEEYLSNLRPRINEKYFKIGKLPREAQYKLRVYRKTMSETEINKLEKIVNDYHDSYALNSLVKHYNTSLNKICRLSDTLEKMNNHTEKEKSLMNEEKNEEIDWQDGTNVKSSLRKHMSMKYINTKIDQTKKNENVESSIVKNKIILKNIVKWRQQELRPNVKMTKSQKNRLLKVELKKKEMDPSTTEPTSNYGIRKIPNSVKIIAIKYAIEQIRRIHHQHDKNIQKKNSSSGLYNLDFYFDNPENNKKDEEDEDDGYYTHTKMMNGNNNDDQLFNVNDLKSSLKNDAMDETTIKKLKKNWVNSQVRKYPVYKMLTNLTFERMQCLMIVAGVAAASCSLLFTKKQKDDVQMTNNLIIRVRNKIQKILKLSKKNNFFKQLNYFEVNNIKIWSDLSNMKLFKDNIDSA